MLPPAHRAFAHIALSSGKFPPSSLHLVNSSSSFSCQRKHLIFRESFSSLSNQVTSACHWLPRLLCSSCHDANFTFTCMIMLWNLTLQSINSLRTGALCSPLYPSAQRCAWPMAHILSALFAEWICEQKPLEFRTLQTCFLGLQVNWLCSLSTWPQRHPRNQISQITEYMNLYGTFRLTHS